MDKSDIDSERNRLSDIYEEMEDLIYAVSHDFRTPLLPIIGFSELMIKRFGDLLPPQGIKYLERINSNAHLLDDYIEGLLSLSRIGRYRKYSARYSRLMKNYKDKFSPSGTKIENEYIISLAASEFFEFAGNYGINVSIKTRGSIIINEHNFDVWCELFRQIIRNSIMYQNAERVKDNKGYLGVFDIDPKSEKYKTLMDVLEGKVYPGYKILYKPPTKENNNVHPYKIMEFIDNGVGLNEEDWQLATGIFKRIENKNTLYYYYLNEREKGDMEREIFLDTMGPSLGLGFSIMRKCARILGISIIIRTISGGNKEEYNKGCSVYVIWK